MVVIFTSLISLAAQSHQQSVNSQWPSH